MWASAPTSIKVERVRRRKQRLADTGRRFCLGLLYLAAMTLGAIRVPRFERYYLRKRAEGKPVT